MDFMIRTRQDLVDAVREFGFLPYFANEIPGFSIEEHCDPKIWFTDEPGVWEWKGPVISDGDCVYGKFFAKKAAFISNKWFCDFANYRRDGYDFDARFEDHLATYNEKYLYDLVAAHHSILSKELKIVGGYAKPKDKGKDSWQPRKGFDTLITKLQMQCYVITSDFEYETDKNGKPYGWGIARYATPEEYLGRKFINNVYKRDPEESKKRIIRHMKKLLPDVPEALIIHFIG
jgi:hypothetical protein